MRVVSILAKRRWQLAKEGPGTPLLLLDFAGLGGRVKGKRIARFELGEIMDEGEL